ncbi:MAG: ABC transporter substrate-binding protein [Asgard group archaeon]|nr:ABC transporter substrate-binding protein [Asgard group archaeon]
MGMSPSLMVMGQEPIYGGIMHTPLSADAHALNPFSWTTTYEAYVIWHIYDPLVRLDLENQAYACIAESWSHSTDFSEWTFVIRDDVYWHDGEKLTIDDVFYTYNLNWNDPDIPRRSWLFDEITELEVVDNTIVITFGWGPKPADVLYDLATTLIVPEHIWADIDLHDYANDVNPIGSGPFKFVEWERAQFFRLEKHDQYQFPIYIDGKTIPIISEVEAAFYALAGGDIEVMANPPPELESAAEFYNASVHTSLNDYWVYLGMNQRRYPNNVTEFRQAIMYGIDRQEIVDVIKYGRGAIMPASCNLPWGTYYNEEAKTYDYNITKTIEMLDDLGWVDTDEDDIREDGLGNPLEFDVIVSADAQESVDTVKFIKTYLEPAGIQVNVVPIIWDVLWTTVGGTGDEANTWDYDWAVLGWVGFWSDFHPSSFYWLLSADNWWGSNAVNIPGWNSTVRTQVTDLCELVLYETDEAVVADLIDQIQVLVAEDLPYLPLQVNGGTYLYKTDEYKGWQLGPTDGPDNYFTWLSIQLISPPESGPGYLALGAILALVITVGLIKFRRRRD